MSSKYVDVTSIMQVIGCIFNNPNLLDYTDKYTITEYDFPDEFHKIVFGTIYKIYELGAKQITLENIADFLSSRPKSEAIFKQQKGEEWLLKVSDAAIPSAFDYYYSRLKKFSLLRAYDNYGVDVSFIYDADNILDVKKRQLQEDQLDSSSLEDLANKVDEMIDNIRMQYVDDVNGESYQAGEGVFDLIDRLKKYPEVGVPLYGPLINTVTRGARLKKFYLRSAPTGIGKAIPNYTIIPTPNGDRRVDEIKAGDYLFGQNGKPTKVLAIHPQPKEKEIWKVTFSDGRVAECCGEHLWEYCYETYQGKEYRVEDTQTIYKRALMLKNGFKTDDNKNYRFQIKLNEPVEYSEKKSLFNPYAMGIFLGEGCKGLNKNLFGQSKVEEFAERYSELYNIKPELQFIPHEYLYGSVQQRFALLRGLLDSRGNVTQKGIMFPTESLKLKKDVIDLCHSLGFITNCSVDACNDIYIQCKEDFKSRLFRVPYKAKLAKNKGKDFKGYLSIVNIEKTKQSAAMTCFTVDNEDHLFLMNDFICTHNTRSMIADACYIACNRIYDETFGWIKNGTAEPVLYISTEQEKEEIQTMMLAFLSNVPEDHILNGKYEEDEEERVYQAANVLSQSPLYIEELPDFSLQDIEDTIKKNIRDKDVKYVFDPK